jgi:two-component system LytT family response regulator
MPRVVIADDEPIAREGIRTQLKKQPAFEVVAECANGLEAVEAIRELAPDLVFLDVQMPELDGFGVVHAIGADRMPAVVFVTAYDAFALQAFEVSAVDYLLKPFDDERFHRAVQRATRQLDRRSVSDMGKQLESLTRVLTGGTKPLERIVVRSGGRIFFLNVAEIYWIKSADNYVELHLRKESHLLRETLNALEVKLEPRTFIRIRRSAMVNVDHVKELRPGFNGEYTIVLENGCLLESSRRYRKNLAPILGE